MKKIVIIGASIAGHTVATALRQIHKSCSITLVTEEDYSLYDKRKLLDLLAGTVKDKEILLSSDEVYRDQNITFLKETRVSSVNTEKKIMYLKNKGVLEYDFLVVCSGRKFVVPDIPGAKKEGVFSLNSLDEFKDFARRLLSGDAVCLVGSGQQVIKIAKILAQKQKELKIFSPNGGALQEIIPSVEGQIEIINSRVMEIIGEHEVQAVKLAEGKIIGASSVVFADELQSNLDFLKNTRVETIRNTILVDDGMRTNIGEIFSCGSVCSKKDMAETGLAEKSWEEVINEGRHLAEILACLIE